MSRDQTELPSLALCALFAVLALGLTLLAGGVYRQCTAQAEQNSTGRTALSYVTNQLRRSDRAGAVEVMPFGGGDALRLEQEEGYELLLYCYNGQFRELYAATDSGAEPTDGTALFPMETMTVSARGSRIDLTFTSSDGDEWETGVSLRCEEGER
ncbi:MAG: DUF4860 domain-containing protein [Pseudoflavonifractor sp.]|nr:DUF4860 domain-containing protein [Pseudoflavonifractor sp.]